MQDQVSQPPEEQDQSTDLELSPLHSFQYQKQQPLLQQNGVLYWGDSIRQIGNHAYGQSSER